jgi:hypothetical protein
MTDLSGRVDTLENQMTYLTQDLLQKIDLVTSSVQSVTWNQQYEELSTTIVSMRESLRSLQSLYVNLSISVSRNFNLFTGHTGNVTVHN